MKIIIEEINDKSFANPYYGVSLMNEEGMKSILNLFSFKYDGEGIWDQETNKQAAIRFAEEYERRFDKPRKTQIIYEKTINHETTI